jgi:tetratricopeptide (TPR) repeat protein
MKKTIISILLIIFSITFCQAQSGLQREAQRQAERDRFAAEQRRREQQEQERQRRAQLSFDDLLRIRNFRDVGEVDRFLTSRGWRFESTNADRFGEIPDDYLQVTWSFDKQRGTDRAIAWFSFYHSEGLSNVVWYQIHEEEHSQRLENAITARGYQRQPATVPDDRTIETRYRRSPLEVVTKKRRNRPNEVGADMAFIFSIHNFVEIERLREEAAQELNALIAEMVRLAMEEAEEEERRRVEKERLAWEAEQSRLQLEREARQRTANYESTIKVAEAHLSINEYAEAIRNFRLALEIKPENANVINRRIREVEEIVRFLGEREHIVRNYAELFPTSHRAINDSLTSELRRMLLRERSVNQTQITFTSIIDTVGVTTNSVTASAINRALRARLDLISNQTRLWQPKIGNYTVSARADFDFTISAEETIIRVKKRASGLSSKSPNYNARSAGISRTLSAAPMGNFTFRFNEATINGRTHTESQLIRYRGTGGPANAWLSLVVPGLGKHRVTHGAKSGLGTLFFTYGFIGAGVGLKFLSDDHYAKYRAATDQDVMDRHYDIANTSNILSYVCIGTAAIIWISDFIWVWNRGAKNKKAQRAYRRQHLSFQYDPNVATPKLTYVLNF